MFLESLLPPCSVAQVNVQSAVGQLSLPHKAIHITQCIVRPVQHRVLRDPQATASPITEGKILQAFRVAEADPTEGTFG